MSVDLFISYSHADELALGRLHKHMAVLLREGVVRAWSDHKILAGDSLGDKISANLKASQIFLALISPDYLASNYCYEKEFQTAVDQWNEGRLRIIPIILEPCDWKATPFGEFLALPKDGKPVSDFTNQNNAYLDVVTALRRVIEDIQRAPAREPVNAAVKTEVRRPKVKQDFDAIQKSEFADAAFGDIRQYFEASCNELNDVGDGNLKAKFERMDERAFTCTVVNRAKRGAEAHITVRNTKGRTHVGDIEYVFQRFAGPGTSNGAIRVAHDDYQMFLSLQNFMSRDDKKHNAQQVAEALWLEFVGQVGIEYD